VSYKRTAASFIYIQEEISDARLRCEELKRYIAKALELINGSEKKDHFYAVAGDLISGMPNTLLKLERALEAAAIVVNKFDTEDLRGSLRPEKIDELDKVLDDIRLRIPRRTGIISDNYDENE